MSAAIHRTDISWPALVAYELGLSADQFRFPTYEWPTGPGGLPLDLERLARAFEQRFGAELDFWEIVQRRAVGARLHGRHRGLLGAGRRAQPTPPTGTAVPQHGGLRLGRPGRRDARRRHRRRTGSASRRRRPAHADRAATTGPRRAGRAASARGAAGGPHRARGCGRDEPRRREGVETLVVMLGANNALGSVVSLSPCVDTRRTTPSRPPQRAACRQGRLQRVAARALRRRLGPARRAAAARRCPARDRGHRAVGDDRPDRPGPGGKVSPDSRYFPYYTRPWITDDDFDPKRDPHITADEARAIDSAIDAYNDTIIDSVAAARARRPGLARVRPGRRCSTGWRPAGTSTARGPGRPGGRPTSCRRSCCALDPVPEHPLLPGRAAGPDGRGRVLPGRRAPHDHRVRPGRPGGHPRDGARRGGVRRPGRHAPDGPGRRRLGPAPAPPTPSSPSPPAVSARPSACSGWLDERLDWVGKVLPFSRGPSLGD